VVEAAEVARVAAEQLRLAVEKKKIEDEKKEFFRKKEEENKRLAAAAAAVQTSGRRSTRVKRTDHRTRYQGSGEWE
jgi:ABC-type molybdate transport system substrate-binding protein